METFLALILTAGWYFLAYRVFSWCRRRLAEHRKRLVENGWKENNVGRRLRGDQYTRLASIVYIVAGALIYLSISAAMPAGMPAIAVVFGSWLGSAFVALVPAALISGVYATYTEWVHPQGDIALKLRDEQWHVAGKEIKPKGEYGRTPIIDAVKAGLTNPSAVLVRPRRVVEEGAK